MSNTYSTKMAEKQGYVLAFDLLLSGATVALWHTESDTFTTYGEHTQDKPSAQLHENIKEILKSADISAADLTLITTPCGPGSFTGIRAGLAAARGLSDAANIPLACPSIPDILLAAEATKKLTPPHIIWLDAMAKDVFYTPNPGEPQLKYSNFTEAQAALPSTGTLITNINPLPELSGDITVEQVNSLNLQDLARYSWQNRAELCQQAPAPLYLKPLTYKTLAEQKKARA